jgi:hypothetical protein
MSEQKLIANTNILQQVGIKHCIATKASYPGTAMQ